MDHETLLSIYQSATAPAEHALRIMQQQESVQKLVSSVNDIKAFHEERALTEFTQAAQAVQELIQQQERSQNLASANALNNAAIHAQQAATLGLIDSISDLTRVLPDIGAILKKLDLESERFSIIMLQLGWPPPGDIPVPTGRNIVRYFDQHGEQETRKLADAKMIQFFSEARLQTMLRKWAQKTWLAQRVPILKQVIEAHIAGLYMVSIPALLPQVEGIFASGFAHQGSMNGATYVTYAKKLLEPKAGVTYDMKAATRDFILKTLLVTFQHGGPINSFMSRHAILHGADTDYGTAVTSLKAILLFDNVQNAFALT